MNEMNQFKTFAFIFSTGGNKLEWSGDDIKALLERAVVPEREKLREWMERCKPGSFLMLSTGCAFCTGMEANVEGPTHLLDGAYRQADASKAFFLEHRHTVFPIAQVTISWDDDLPVRTSVISADGSTIDLSGFGIGSGAGGEGVTGLIWLLDQCGIDYNRGNLVTLSTSRPGSLTLYPMQQSATELLVWTYSHNLEELPTLWLASVEVERANGQPIKLEYPPSDVDGLLYDDITELIDIVIYDCRVRGIEWTADPRILFNDKIVEIVPEGWQLICHEQSERIGWKHD